MSLYLDYHILQTVPPSCINRDDTGSPKTAYYGGTMRARVSSQAWKRAMRIMFEELFQEEMKGKRTRETVMLVADKMLQIRPDITSEKAVECADKVLELAGVTAGGDKKKVLFLISNLQISNVAALAVEYYDDPNKPKDKEKNYKKRLEKALQDNPSIDILLFGRMAASNPSLNYDAAVQVAHSISTHVVSNEYDYFTAVDDANLDDSGAGHLGTVEFNSSTMYRYATMNVSELQENLRTEELLTAVKGFTEAFVRSMPMGKMNSFANRTLPDLVYITIRENQPVNLARAFENPVKANGQGYAKESAVRLKKYAEEVYENYVSYPNHAWIIGDDWGEKAHKVTLVKLQYSKASAPMLTTLSGIVILVKLLQLRKI